MGIRHFSAKPGTPDEATVAFLALESALSALSKLELVDDTFDASAHYHVLDAHKIVSEKYNFEKG